MTSEIAYTINSSPGLDPGRSVLQPTKQGRIPGSSNQGNIVHLNRQDKVQPEEGGEQKKDGTSQLFMKSLQEEFELIHKVELKFNRDQDTGQTYIKIVDKDSGNVVREIPPEFLRKLAEKMDEMVGILFDRKA